MENNFDPENESTRFKKKKKKKKYFDPYKKDKYTISKLKEYKKYLEYLESVRAQGNLDLEY